MGSEKINSLNSLSFYLVIPQVGWKITKKYGTLDSWTKWRWIHKS